MGVVGGDSDGVDIDGERLGDTWDGGGGVALLSCGEDGRPGHVVRDREALDELDTVDPESEMEDCVECLLRVLVKVDEALLKSDLAGDVVRDGPGSDTFGDCGDGKPGMLMSLRMTIRVRCKRFRANLFET